MTQTAADLDTSDRRSEEVSETVIAAVAEAKGVDPIDLEPLYAVVDPDALDSLFGPSFDSAATSMELRFSMAGCQVVVRGDGEVVVTTPTEDDARPTPTAPRDS